MAIEANKPGDNNAQLIYIPIIVFTIIAPALVGMRLWSRLRKDGGFGSDDWTIIASLIASLASSGVMIASCQYGFGQHIYNITKYNKTQALMYFYICQLTYKASIGLTKISILLLCDRIFGKIRWFHYTSWFMITAVVLYLAASLIITVFQCTPVPRAFNKSIPGTCIDIAKFWYANGGFNIATDIIILVLPMPVIRSLQIPRLHKAALVVVFALGGFVVVTSCLRMTTINLSAVTPDVTYEVWSTMWTMIEMNVAIVCACLPMIRPLMIWLFPTFFPKSSSRRKIPNFENQGYAVYRSDKNNPFPSRHSRSGHEIMGKDDIILRSLPHQGSEEFILDDAWLTGTRGPDVPNHHVRQPSRLGQLGELGISESSVHALVHSLPMGAANKQTGIHKTMQYTVQYEGRMTSNDT